ncbi:hypothetical protein [Leadbettera azotonutricia]|uniref:hypothetical protein n=1 Tax=Leadbettera azotonutricia TaxID=150829 RepID=UPI001FE13656|nr:hypothetical protein [Leadbettera azotonutricia]
MLAFHIPRANPATLNLDDDIIIPALRRRVCTLIAVVGFAIRHQGLHCFWIITHALPPFCDTMI